MEDVRHVADTETVDPIPTSRPHFCVCQRCGHKLTGPRGPILELIIHNVAEHGRYPVVRYE